MRNRALPVLIVSLALCALDCKNDDDPIDPIDDPVDPATELLVETLDKELVPLSPDPLKWTDSELHFLDNVSDHAIVGLGEATHGTSEFFKAKHRIFKYLVENHGFKIFAIEADFGESLFINQAVLNSDKNQIEALMKDKMHFWTWRTNEVRDLLYWMCDYNLGKTDDEKVQYWGVDCQFNTFHPEMVKDQLTAANVPFMSFAEEILAEARSSSNGHFSAYTMDTFGTYLERIHALKDSLTKYEADIIAAGSEKQFQLTLQLVEVIKQVSEVIYYTEKTSATKNYRDEYMAENTGWLHEYFEGAKAVLWAHNFHVSDYKNAGSMGYHLKADFPGDYTTLGFLFSKGFFTAVTLTGDQYRGVNVQTLEDNPRQGSINYVMSHAKTDVFTVTLSDLQGHDGWNHAFLDGIEFFQMGAVYNDNPSDYYSPFEVDFFERVIYINRTTAAVQVK